MPRLQHLVLDQPGNILALKDSSLLSRAVSKAPSGQLLYEDLSTLQSDVITAAGAQCSSGAGDKLLTISQASSVETDCQSVNPSS